MLRQADAVRAELMRLASFSKWPVEPALTTASLVCLAAAGFSYTGNSDGIVCVHCKTVIRGWNATRHSPLLEHWCPSKPPVATHHAADPPQHNADSSAAGSYEPTARNCRKIVPEPENDVTPKSCDLVQLVARDLGAVNCDNERLTDGASASSLSQQMALVGVDDVVEPASGDVRDAAAANSSKSVYIFLKFKLQIIAFIFCYRPSPRGISLQ